MINTKQKKEKIMKTKTLLRRACENDFGYFDATPGADIATELGYLASESTIKRYITEGWIKQIGSGLVLTQDGYNRI